MSQPLLSRSEALKVFAAMIVVACIAFALGSCSAQTTKPKGSIPNGWSKLNLSAEQATKIRAISFDYRKKMADLEAQLVTLRQQERAEQVKLLTPAQKATLAKLFGVEPTEPTPPKKDK